MMNANCKIFYKYRRQYMIINADEQMLTHPCGIDIWAVLNLHRDFHDVKRNLLIVYEIEIIRASDRLSKSER
jgi:hypothetical protein